MVRREAPTYAHFHYARGLATRTLAQNLDSLVRVSRRVADDHYASVLAEARSSAPGGGMPQGAVTLPREPRSPSRCPPAGADAGPGAAECAGENAG